MSRRKSTRKRHARIRRELLETGPRERMKAHDKHNEQFKSKSDALDKANTGGNSFESKRRKH